MNAWKPALPSGPGPISRRLAEALARDIGAGALAAGARLPPQRDLAHRLGVSIGVVTKAYAEAERSGLITAHVGRGSFVADAAAAAGADDMVDLARNLPPFGPARARLADAVARLPRTPGFLDAVAYAPAAGGLIQRRAMAGWIAATSGMTVPVERVMLTAGAQQAMALALAAVCRPGDTVLCEAATYFGIKNLAEHAGYRLVGLAMDAEGLRPDALEAAPQARALFVLPTIQNPTGRIMGAERRRQIVAVARRRQLWMVEDDVYAGYAPGHEPLAAMAPELTFFLTSISKVVAPGLRAGALVAPVGGGHEPALLRGLQALSVAGGSLGWMVAAQWIESGVAGEITRAVLDEAEMRLALALDILGPAAERPPSPASPHIWLPMPELDAERVAGRAMRASVQVTPPASCMVDPRLESGVRIALGATPDRITLGRGLRAVAEALSPRLEAAGQPMV